MGQEGKLIKVLIEAYDDEDFQKKSKIDPNPISLPVNPESYTKNYKVELNQQQGQGNQGTNPDYKGTKPEELKLEFIFDGTETIEGYIYNSGNHSVKKQIDIFMDAVYNMNGDIHRPHFLKVKWGDLTFPCILSNLDLNYTLFDHCGNPLRVKASATFLNYIAQKERVARENKKSPDLTHVRMAKAGDRLDLMTSNIYNDPKYVTQVAKANDLTSFRQIQPGKEFIFPPLDKTATT
ncbi:hypothetical protein OOZ15_10250 [Galbibacter sp. EGI 63066]|uniref:CIS tube protein n=1 Tax=Galbibacter sp. EGI 63066 TaxID=2993559 RepID=UPI002248EEDA|nr:hypothetical protein [Galbibacter sp. EGI 63066]MCX2680321.1 hypothetical protein [Galbibacter sp. EGI 63066]